jgi:uncharacterized FlaG/YvyC family protein
MVVAPISSSAQAPPPPNAPSSTAQAKDRDAISTIKSMDTSGLFGVGTDLTFALDRNTKQLVARVVNQHTGEIVWQAPPQYMLELAEAFAQPSG